MRGFSGCTTSTLALRAERISPPTWANRLACSGRSGKPTISAGKIA